jgi:hypothetical protein
MCLVNFNRRPYRLFRRRSAYYDEEEATSLRIVSPISFKNQRCIPTPQIRVEGEHLGVGEGDENRRKVLKGLLKGITPG